MQGHNGTAAIIKQLLRQFPDFWPTAKSARMLFAPEII
ncbi:hypothetical protein CEV31_3811 [Brucella thiophenivorans]|uniref:Uncharacterized protein n=1 Tax=Brucella thiophenivorans TaxID=571255 RepID=A0A256F9A8_9HYPH|nr:hypothetical protein CEV31_3811 [Brucella thiophenivorans]